MHKLQIDGDDVVLIEFFSQPGEMPQTKEIRQIITFGDLARQYSRDGNPYTHFQVEWNKEYEELLVYKSLNGFDGLSGLYWVDEQHAHLVEEAEQLNLKYVQEGWLKSLPEIQAVDRLEIDLCEKISQSSWTDSGQVYCTIKDDWYNDEPGCVHSPHLIWVDRWGCWGGCGASEGKLSELQLEEEFFPLLDLAGLPSVRALKEALEQHCYVIEAKTVLISDVELDSRTPNFGHTQYCRFQCSQDLDDEIVQRCEGAIAWLNSLKAGVTTEADLTTAAWIEHYLSR
ncbi:hypothetical protein ACQ4M3_07885 [Leptolyngbya sp. AN03gr2]|uniref:hypothetical protein n=1 Tax=unclassified Leptolyngbya TaxID=2650499 RepID=UPI003D317D53